MRVQSRRSVLGAAALSTLALAAPSTPASAAAIRSGARLGLVRSAFSPYVGRRFTLSGPGVITTARLTAVEDLAAVPRRNDQRRFSLLFRADRRLPGGQGVYRVRRSGVGGVDLFVVPVDRGVRGHHYQAIVNRRTVGSARSGSAS